jgi:DNA-binding NtrC family response regulator
MPSLLVIDDEPSIRLSIQAVFSRTDVIVLGAENAEEGLRLTVEHSPDVILLDVKLGTASGLAVFHKLRRIDPRCPIIFITGFGTTDTAIETMKLGAYDHPTKPLDAKQLKRVFDQALAASAGRAGLWTRPVRQCAGRVLAGRGRLRG